MYNNQLIRNVVEVEGDITKVYFDYIGKRYELRLNTKDMDRVNKELSMISMRKISNSEMPKAFAVFRKEYRKQVCNPSKRDSVPLSRYLLNTPLEEGYVAPTIVNGCCIDFTDGHLRVLDMYTKCNTNPKDTKGAGNRGIYIKKRSGGKVKYEAGIYVNGKRKYLGIFDTEQQALQVRIRAEKEYWGETLEDMCGGNSQDEK